MKFRLYFASLFALFFNTTFAQPLISTRTDSLIHTGIHLSLEQAYEDAISVFTQIKIEEPESPIGYFFHAVVLQAQMLDFEIYDRVDEFESLLDIAIERAKKKIRQNSKDAWAHFFLGSAYGYRAYFQGKQNKYVPSLQNSMRSVKALKHALKLDDTLYDAYLGWGSIIYYKGYASRFVSWLPFVEDKSADGIEMIKTAMEKSRYSRYNALSALCLIYHEEEKSEEGYKLINAALKEFPENRAFLWMAAKLNKQLGHWQEAISYFEKILASLKEQNALSAYNELSCREYLIEIYLAMNDFQRARKECGKISRLNLTKQEKKRAKNKLKSVDESCREYALHQEK